MNKATHEKSIQGLALLSRAVGDRENIAFEMTEDLDPDKHARPGRDETAARVLSRAPKRLVHQGGRVQWADEGTNLYPAYDISTTTPKDDSPRLSLAVAFVDDSAYITGLLRKAFKRVGGNRWIDFPSSQRIAALCCAGDGQVYAATAPDQTDVSDPP